MSCCYGVRSRRNFFGPLFVNFLDPPLCQMAFIYDDDDDDDDDDDVDDDTF